MENNALEEILRHIKEDEVVELLQKLVRFPSINPPCQLDEIASFVADQLRGYGLEVEIEGDRGDTWARPNVIGTLNGRGGKPTLLLAAHTDVVPAKDLSLWELDPFAAEIIDGTIYGRGTADTKGSLAAMMAAVKAVIKSGVQLKGCVKLVAWAGDEWQPPDAKWFNGLSYLAAYGLLKGDAVVLGEPYDLKVCYTSRGRIWFDFEVGGEATHSATGKGVNAILKAIKLIQGIYQIKVGEHPVLGKDTINIGTIEAGTQPNIVPDSCRFTFDIRFGPPLTTEKIEEMVKEVIKDLEKTDQQFQLKKMEVTERREPLEFPQHSNLNRAIREAGRDALGKGLDFGGALSFGDTADWKDAVGLKEACLFGPGKTKEAHAINEHIEIADLLAAAKVYALTIPYYCGVIS
ncbi:MAG: M20 family metallopeptidase [Anaerolineae bacterium]|nr:M20 family metallopeptidase [Anaerolineae bacterium]